MITQLWIMIVIELPLHNNTNVYNMEWYRCDMAGRMKDEHACSF